MRSIGQILLQRDPFEEIVIGNTAVVRAMMESGVRVVTTYPGSPTPEIASAVLSIPEKERPFYFEYSTNEKVATEVAFGASVNGHLSCVFFKSVGLNVAADSFVQLGHMELTGGMVIVLGDDPGANSSQNEQDNRHYAHMSFTPLFEPATPREAYEMFLEAAEVSREKHMPVILRMTTHVCHAKQKVPFSSWSPALGDDTPRFDPARGPYIPIARAALDMKRKALAKLRNMEQYSEQCRFHLESRNPHTERGIITFGLPYLSVLEALEEVEKVPSVLKLGLVHPLPRERIAAFLKSHAEVLVVEELDPLMETAVKAIAYEEGITTRIKGKTCDEDRVGEYTPDKVASILARVWPDLGIPVETVEDSPLSPRPPQMCPGCGHRSAFHAIKQALSDSDITVADIGCHTLGFLPPYNMGQVLLSMGHSTGTASGLSLFNTDRKVVAFIGDSTLFHAGIPGIINALFNRHNVTLVIMENGTTAMTGHQNHPGSGANAREAVDAISIERMLEGLGVEDVRRVDTYSQGKLKQILREAVDKEGFSVVIASHPCMLKFTREQRRKPDYVQKAVKIDQDKCTLAQVCISEFGCPSFQRGEDGRIRVNPELCIGDGSCIQTCPSRAIGLDKPSSEEKEDAR
jgi:indolepyruvate ferredoxin oxidoreductase alpha subunit